MADWDWIVAGAGHNGLVTAACLARTGQRVLALDQADMVGGGASTRQVTLPGFQHNLHAMRILPWPLVVEELGLARYGLEFIWRDTYAANVFADGQALVRYVDLDRAVAEIARFNRHDATTYRDLYFETQHVRAAARKRRLLRAQPPGGAPAIDPQHPLSATLARWYHMSQLQVLKELFDDEHVRVSLRGSLQTVSFPGDIPLTGLNVCTGMLSFHDGPSTVIRGGTWQYARALQCALEEAGGQVRLNAMVRQIVTGGGRASGVVLDSGERIEAGRGVIAGFGHKVLLDTVDHALLPSSYLEPVQRMRGEELVIFAVHAAIDGPVRWRAAADNADVDDCLDVTFGLERSLDLVMSYNDGREGNLPRHLSGFVDTPSAWDPSYAPPGQSSVDVGVIVPYALQDGGPAAWDSVKDELADRAVDTWLRHTHLTRDQLLARYVFSPLDIVRSNPSFFEGSPVQGSSLPDQMGVFRPAFGWSDYATPIEGLYVSNASAHPLGGLNGIPGHNCASRIAEDYGLPVWWQAAARP